MGPQAPSRSAVLRQWARQTPVSLGFLALCFLFTVPVTLAPRLYDLFGGIAPREHPWQPFTAAFVHGWPGLHGSIHIALNSFLILECGRPCERMLGGPRFLLLSVLALIANAAVVSATEGANGSSLVIWAWGPPLYVALRRGANRDPSLMQRAGYQRLMGILVLMYVVITLLMGLLPYAFGWRGNFVEALVRANLFHLVATGVGVLAAFVWKPGRA